MVQGINISEIREGSWAGPVRTGQLGKLQDRPKVAKIDESKACFSQIGRLVQCIHFPSAQDLSRTSWSAKNQHSTIKHKLHLSAVDYVFCMLHTIGSLAL